MPTTTASLSYYNEFIDAVIDHEIDIASDTLKVALFTDSYTPDNSATTYSALSGETTNGNGYATGGQALANTSWTRTNNDWYYDADNTEWTASGGSIVAKYYVLYSDTATSRDLICWGYLDGSEQDEKTTADGKKITLQWNASGVFAVIAFSN